MRIPAGLLAYASRSAAWRSWLDRLPRLMRDVLSEWELTPDGEPRYGAAALVVPVVESSGRRAVVKFSWPHEEEEHEHLALQALRGNGMALLYRADPARHVMLLERLDAERDLCSVPILEACEIVAGFFQRIHVPALPQLRPLSSYLERWTGRLAALDSSPLVPRRLVDRTVSLTRSFVAEPDTDGVLIHGDLHYANVLAGGREPWLVIDPKPMAGNAHYEVAPLLWNRWDEAVATGNIRRALRLRLETAVDVAGLDEDRARAWVVVRMMHNALWCIEDSPGGLTSEDRDELTTYITIAKAMAD